MTVHTFWGMNRRGKDASKEEKRKLQRNVVSQKPREENVSRRKKWAVVLKTEKSVGKYLMALMSNCLWVVA